MYTKEQRTKKVRNWRNKDKFHVAEYARLYRIKIKKLVFEYYGNHCACCNEINSLFLTIDHKNNDGYKYKDKNGKRIASMVLYLQIVKRGFPNEYQLLCWNCNLGKRMNRGICPHLNLIGM